jgi:superkiller protein 3
MFHDWNWSEAERELNQATAIDPNVMLTWYLLGFCQAAHDRLPEALASIQRSQALDPLAAPRRNELAMCYNWMRRHDDAIAEAQKALELDRDFPLAYAELGLAHVQQGMCDKAIAELNETLDRGYQHPRVKGMLGYAYAAAGQRAEAQKVLLALETLAPKRFGFAFPIARIYAAQGEKDEAFKWLQKACDERDSLAIWLKVDPTLDNLRKDLRFAQMLEDMRLPP